MTALGSSVTAEEWTPWYQTTQWGGTVYTIESSSDNDYISEICIREWDRGQSAGPYVHGIKVTFASGETLGWLGGSER